MQPPVKLFIAMSLDGFIAGPNDNLDFLSLVESPGEDYGYSTFVSTVDTVIMGRKTYEKVLSFGGEFPHAGRKCYVLTGSDLPGDPDVEFYRGTVESLISMIRQHPSKGIYCDGGASVISQLMQKDLIDELTISIIPVVLGNGTRLFSENIPELRLKLSGAKHYPTGLVQLHYVRKN